jgi:hypothetical protein
MVDSYISPSSRRKASAFIGALGKVSLNRNLAYSSSKPHFLKTTLYPVMRIPTPLFFLHG